MAKTTKPRKIHNKEPGYIAERKNPYTPDKVVIYIAEEQGIDADHKYVVVCDTHGTLCSTTSIPDARVLMKNPDEFCETCRDLQEFESLELPPLPPSQPDIQNIVDMHTKY